jgi:sRNA-binding regulator protein Hfq
MSVREKFLKEMRDTKKVMKVFLDDSKGTMLQGVIVEEDDVSFVIDKCLVNWDKVISVTPVR